MKHSQKFTLALALSIGVISATAATSQALPTARVAARMLFKTGKNATRVNILRLDLIPAPLQPAIRGAASIQKYYEAMAVSPSEGLQSASAFQAINHHSAAAAGAAALAGCNAKKKKASDDCVVVAEFLPKKYDGPRAFSLSMNATEVFLKKYRRARKNRAFAISPATGNWGFAVKAKTIAAARAAALADCATKTAPTGINDCRIVSEN